MKIIVLSLALLGTAFATAPSGPKIDTVASITIRDAEFVVVCVLQESSEIDVVLSCFRRAKKVGVSSDRKAFPYKVDIDSRRLYDADTGEFTLLSKAEQPVFRLSEPDRISVNELFLKKTPTTEVGSELKN